MSGLNLPSNWSEGNSSIHCLWKPAVPGNEHHDCPQQAGPVPRPDGTPCPSHTRKVERGNLVPSNPPKSLELPSLGKAEPSAAEPTLPPADIPPAVWFSLQERTGEGTDGDDLGLQMQLIGFRVSGMRLEHPWPRGRHPSRSPPPLDPQRSQSAGTREVVLSQPLLASVLLL